MKEVIVNYDDVSAGFDRSYVVHCVIWPRNKHSYVSEVVAIPTGDKGQDCHRKGSKARLRQGWLFFFRIAKH